MNAAKKLAKKNVRKRELEAGKKFASMVNEGKSAKEIGEAFGIPEQKASQLIFEFKARTKDAYKNWCQDEWAALAVDKDASGE